jgi:D-glycero-alpha-D-manno-heptose-7-phosphate kinase
MKFVTKAPTRIDLAGGTLDLWPIHHSLRGAMTINCAIACWAKTTIEIADARDRDQAKKFQISSLDQNWQEHWADYESSLASRFVLLAEILATLWHKDLPGLSITTEALSPKGAGLGGSSALGVAISHGLLTARASLDPTWQIWPEGKIVDFVRNVEARIINAPAGVQDHWAAVRGGVNILSFKDEAVLVETLPGALAEDLNRRMVLIYTGSSRDSAMNNWIIFKNFYDGHKETRFLLAEIAKCSQQCAEALRGGSIENALQASREEWQLRQGLWPSITTPEFHKISQAAQAAGADFSRFCGAGGGGVMAVFGPASVQQSVAKACQEAGGKLLESQISDAGVNTVLLGVKLSG